MKKMAKNVEMGLDAQESFAQMYKDGNMNKRVWGEMMKLDPVVIQESRKEIRERNSQSSLKIRGKSYDFANIFIRTIFTQGMTPLDY